MREKTPFIFNIMRLYLFLRQLLFDPKNIKNNTTLYKQVKDLQINKKTTIFLDRQDEIKEFFKLSNLDMLKIYLRHGPPNTIFF
jgi:hypothetical protein